jgi:hypothetical protein
MAFWTIPRLAVLLVVATGALCQDPSPVNTTICEIVRKPDFYDGKLVEVTATQSGTWEGSWLLDTHCDEAFWFTTPEVAAEIASITGDTTTPKARFRVVENDDYRKFSQYANATVENFQREYDVTATFVGLVQRRDDFKLSPNGFGNGFGHMGVSEFQFVLRSVSNIKAQKTNVLTTIPSIVNEAIPEVRSCR